METFSTILAICAGNSPVPGEFPAQRSVARRFDVFFDLRLNTRFSKQPWGWWFETSSWSLLPHCNVYLYWGNSGRSHTIVSLNDNINSLEKICAYFLIRISTEQPLRLIDLILCCVLLVFSNHLYIIIGLLSIKMKAVSSLHVLQSRSGEIGCWNDLSIWN